MYHVYVGSEGEETGLNYSQLVCSLCQSKGKGHMVVCEGCNAPTHTTYLGLGPHAYPGGFSQCAQCVLLSAHVEVGQASLNAEENAHMLVWLRAKRVTDSSQATYVSGLHRYVRYAQVVLLLSPESVLPPKSKQGPLQEHVELFIAWAASRYKYNTILSTVSALIDWCISKGAPRDSLTCSAVTRLLKTVKAEQGPAGLPIGKTGMSKISCASYSRTWPGRPKEYPPLPHYSLETVHGWC